MCACNTYVITPVLHVGVQYTVKKVNACILVNNVGEMRKVSLVHSNHITISVQASTQFFVMMIVYSQDCFNYKIKGTQPVTQLINYFALFTVLKHHTRCFVATPNQNKGSMSMQDCGIYS